MLETCLSTTILEEEYEQYIAHVEKYGRDFGLYKMMDEYSLNIILGPIESSLVCFGAAAGELSAVALSQHIANIELQAHPLPPCPLAISTLMADRMGSVPWLDHTTMAFSFSFKAHSRRPFRRAVPRYCSQPTSREPIPW